MACRSCILTTNFLVVQDTVTAEWFRGRDISIAMGLATSASGMVRFFLLVSVFI